MFTAYELKTLTRRKISNKLIKIIVLASILTLVNGQLQLPRGIVPQKEEPYGDGNWMSPSSQPDSPTPTGGGGASGTGSSSSKLPSTPHIGAMVTLTSQGSNVQSAVFSPTSHGHPSNDVNISI